MSAPPDRPISTVLVGFGHGGRVFHAPLLRHDPRFDVAAVVTRSEARQDAARTEHPDAVVVGTLGDALRAVPALELAVITTPNATHGPLATAALAAGLHVVVDKPLVVDAEEGERLRHAALQAGRLLVPFHNRRWDGDVLAVRAAVDAGRLGSVRSVESAVESWKPTVGKAWKREAAPAAGGGVLHDLGTHLIDQALVLFGPGEAVFAQLHRNREDTSAEDTAFVVIEHASGVTSHVRAGTLEPLARPRFRVTGSAGSLVITGTDPQEALLDRGVPPAGVAVAAAGLPGASRGVLGAGGTAEPFPVGPGDYPAFYAGLAAAIDGEGPPPVAVEEALAVVRLIERVHAAFPVRRGPR
ncbi:Gfo/Idh/MocA family protein [Arthrobacter sp. N1]|uniref:Gfo/Idh/MocA family protein n=1 Tax=Arthrobacter sp. N1 TaxID=619291 RepID=UPI003BB06498